MGCVDLLGEIPWLRRAAVTEFEKFGLGKSVCYVVEESLLMDIRTAPSVINKKRRKFIRTVG
jgi:hypothetical protein